MDIVLTGFLSIASFLYHDHKPFFEQAIKEMRQGAEWHYVGRQPLDPTAKAIPAQICNHTTGECGEPYIMWKLKMPTK